MQFSRGLLIPSSANSSFLLLDFCKDLIQPVTLFFLPAFDLNEWKKLGGICEIDLLFVLIVQRYNFINLLEFIKASFTWFFYLILQTVLEVLSVLHNSPQVCAVALTEETGSPRYG